jgi:hypothetical protein
MKPQFQKGDLIEVTNELVGTINDSRKLYNRPLRNNPPKGMMGFVVGFHSFQKGPYNQSWYDVHLADGRTLMMLGNWFKKVNK